MNQRQHEAKLALAESFAQLVEQLPIERITINMIADAAGKHRKTFYYHFADKEQLVVWLFRHDLAVGLRERFAERDLIRNPDDVGTALEEFPYYLRNVTATGRLYNAPFFETFARSLERRRTYYRRIFSKTGPGTLERYLQDLYCPALKDDILAIASARGTDAAPALSGQAPWHEQHREGIEFLAEFFTGAFVSRFVNRLNYTSARRTDDEIAPFENVIHDSIAALIELQGDRGTARKAEPRRSDPRPLGTAEEAAEEGDAPCASPA